MAFLWYEGSMTPRLINVGLQIESSVSETKKTSLCQQGRLMDKLNFWMYDFDFEEKYLQKALAHLALFSPYLLS